MSFVHQNLGLVMELNAVDNLALHGGFTRTAYGRVRWREQARIDAPADGSVRRRLRRHATAVQGDTGRAHDRRHRRCPAGLGRRRGGVLVLDEPTAVLPPGEVQRLFTIVRNLRSRGAGILYVSHRLDEIFELADRVTVLRNGERVITRDVTGLTKGELVHLMLGVEMEPDYRAPVPEEVHSQPLLEVRGLAGTYLRDATFTLHAGEVLGIAGLPDSGRDELPRILTDQIGHATGGSIRLTSVSPEWMGIGAWRARNVALLPPDRGKEGIVGPMSVGENLSLSVLQQLATGCASTAAANEASATAGSKSST